MANPKILVVDDDDTIISVVEAILKKNGYNPVCAHGGEEGLQMANDESPDAILLDRIMPDMDGNEVLRSLQESQKTREIPVIMLTGKNAIHDVSASLELGARDYIVKPFDEENLLVRLKNIMAKKNQA